ncbi:ribonuclease H-like domain-containing protein [Tanacetum coccineum]|uniref:Ribonuclease H-like domain-containing protein n=1 Tax=Tanacetum coccineum TaxID=301880 RepID=A0ABQ4XW01_9ASTR
MAGDDIPKKGVSSSSSDLNLTFGDPLYLHPNDTGGSPIVTIKLIGIENYKAGSIAMTFALRNHNKIGFIDGSCEKDNTNPALANQLDMCNSVDTYDKGDGSAVFKLHKSINSLNQSGASLADYYNNLNSLWKQFDAMVSLHAYTCEAAIHFEKHNQLIKLMQFLMDLDDNYLAIRSNILIREPLPLVKAAFAIVGDEESHRNITSVEATKPTTTAFAAKSFDKKRFNSNNYNKGSSSNSNSNNRGPNPNLKCTNCNKIGHTVNRCFELVGYPAGCVKRNFNPTSRFVSSNNTSANIHSNGVSSNNATTNNSHVSLSNEQLTRLMNLLNDNGVSTDNANMAEYTVSLLSVHKLSRDSKLFVGFDESNCYIQDLKENRTVEIGKQFNGLYLFDIDNAYDFSRAVWVYMLKRKDDVYDSIGNNDSKATSMDENNNTHPEGTVSNETDFVNDFYENSEFHSEVEELPVNTVRRSSGLTKLPTSLNDFFIKGKVKYGIEKVVNYANLNHENF